MTQLRPAPDVRGPDRTAAAGRGTGRRRGADPRRYEAMVEQVAGDLGDQAAGGPVSLLAVMPVVGFGEQAADVVLPSLELVAGALGAAAVLVVLVNRPLHQAVDSTLARVRAWARHRDRPRVAVAEVALCQRPRIGELRQLGLDAAERALGPLPPDAAVLLVDDDAVAVPPGTATGLQRALRVADLGVGPVLFDSPALPTSRFPDLYAGDLFRALLTDDLLARAERDPSTLPAPVLESVVLSGHLAVRRDALARAGGMSDLNELTRLARDVVALDRRGSRTALARSVVLPAAGQDPVARLQHLAVRMHSRRALAAYACDGAATVAQWRSQRLRSSAVDPVRVRPPALRPPPPLAAVPAADRAQVAGDVARHLAVVLDHLQPPVECAARALGLLGAGPGDVALESPAAGGGWRVDLHRPAGLVDRLAELQAADAAGREAGAAGGAAGAAGRAAGGRPR